LTEQFQRLVDVLPEVEWFRKNANTERAYCNASWTSNASRASPVSDEPKYASPEQAR
jgi:hypothetical protein